MHKELNNLMQRRGIKDISDMSDEERTTYMEWDRVLSEGSLTVEKITRFCEDELNRIDVKWKQDVGDANPARNERLITMRVVYQTLLEVIKAPKKDREALEQYLKTLV